jgi:GTPase SAR1 family protein
LSKAIQEETKVIKMLLLGAGESGKSTIFKQMKIINKNGYSEKERKEFIGIVASNTIQSMTNIMEAFEKLETSIPGDLKSLQAKFDELKGPEKLDEEIGKVIKDMWAHAAVQAIFERKSEYQLNDSADYYFNKVDTLMAPGYIPSEEDVLRSRVRTTGIVQSDFKIKSINFSMFDVGGQRNERRKWIHAFDNVNCVIFVAALSEYDQKLFEDETMNRMDEALSLFDQIVNSKWFKQTAMILFLNKKDLFEEKLKKKPLTDFYEPAQGEVSDGTNFKECSEFLKGAFLKKNKNSSKSIFSHITTAVDTSNVKFVFNAVVAIILEENLKSSGLA